MKLQVNFKSPPFTLVLSVAFFVLTLVVSNEKNAVNKLTGSRAELERRTIGADINSLRDSAISGAKSKGETSYSYQFSRALPFPISI